MERAELLIMKLGEQYRKKEPASQILQTLQLLQQEILAMARSSSVQPVNRKVSVIMPFRFEMRDGVPEGTEEKTVELLHIDEEEIERELEQLRKAAELKNDMGLSAKAAVQEQYDPMEEVPTLATHVPAAEPARLYSRAAAAEEKSDPSKEINETLKAPKTELAEILQDVPIKDLRKAIGINDRYLFINELFQGDEAMFERSVKTINQFTILPEAEFWIQRELKLKLGWKDDKPQVKQFIQLVRRRFS